MKVIIIGLPYFAKEVASKLSKHSPENTFIPLDTNGSKIDKVKFLFHLPSTDLVFSIGGSTKKGGAFNATQRFGKKLVIYWAGSDVLKAKREKESGLSDWDFVNNVSHYCCAPWFEDELEEIGITAITKYIASIKPSNIKEWPKDFSVLAYVGKDKPNFYGLERIANTAKALPHIHFYLAGYESTKGLPANIHGLKWTNNFKKEMQKHKIFLRVPEHDGLGFSVIEALASGRHVIRSNNFPHCHFAMSEKEIIAKLNLLYESHLNGNLTLNEIGIDYVLSNFEEEKIYKDLLETLILEAKK